MRGVAASPRWSRLVVIVTVLLAPGLAVSGCGSSGATPGGLSGEQASGFADKQYTAEDHQAATLLTPAPGTFLAGKTTVTPLGSTTPPALRPRTTRWRPTGWAPSG